MVIATYLGASVERVSIFLLFCLESATNSGSHHNLTHRFVIKKLLK